ncbi:MAG: tRNA (guanosine(46)-N7)-methyltransferase TrmB, partial [Bacteroidales bacterium]|nr:tRNA (guanosine(46)-N7)-methyltransferase TrmB [Bacteroidales bacterium]
MAKHKLARFAENLTFPNLFQVSFEYLQEHGFEWRGRWNAFFGNNNPIVLELGCGKGEYTIALARENPDHNHIGVDIKGARLWRGAKTSNEEHMGNVAFVRTRIELISSFFAPGEVSEIWVTFPDPQPKKPMKRLTSERFLERYRQILAPGSPVHLKTDSQELYEYTLNEVVLDSGYKLLYATNDLYGQHDDGSGDNSLRMARQVQTFYESMFLKEGKSITYLKFEID